MDSRLNSESLRERGICHLAGTRSTRRVDRSIVDRPMNLKTLRKKIRKLETRLQETPQKLVKLRQKLEAMTKAKARKAKRKSAARDAAARRTTNASAPTQEEKGRSTAQPETKVSVALERSPAKKAKRKLNLSPERRAQLAAAMKARWAAKRAAADGNLQESSTKGDTG